MERQNQTLTNILLKLKEDVNCDWETALAWAVSAKNSMINNNGFSPAQLVFANLMLILANIPSKFTAKLPALESKPASAVLSESSEKIKRAL